MFTFIGAGNESGIGAATAIYMVQFQPKLVLTGRNPEKLERVGEQIYEAGLPKDKVRSLEIFAKIC